MFIIENVRDSRTHEIDMGLARIIEFRDNVGELAENLVVSGHVRGKDTSDDPFAYHPIGGIVQRRQYVALGGLEDAERHRAMVILERRDVVVTERQLGTGVYLINVVVSRMIQVVADAGDD